MVVFRELNNGNVKSFSFKNDSEAVDYYKDREDAVYLAWRACPEDEIIKKSLMTDKVSEAASFAEENICYVDVFERYEDVGYFIKEMNEGF